MGLLRYTNKYITENPRDAALISAGLGTGAVAGSIATSAYTKLYRRLNPPTLDEVGAVSPYSSGIRTANFFAAPKLKPFMTLANNNKGAVAGAIAGGASQTGVMEDEETRSKTNLAARAAKVVGGAALGGAAGLGVQGAWQARGMTPRPEPVVQSAPTAPKPQNATPPGADPTMNGTKPRPGQSPEDFAREFREKQEAQKNPFYNKTPDQAFSDTLKVSDVGERARLLNIQRDALKAQLDSGTITREEFNRLKKQIVKEMQSAQNKAPGTFSVDLTKATSFRSSPSVRLYR